MKNVTRGWATSTRFYLGSRSLGWPVRVYVYMHVVSSVSNWVNNAAVFLCTYILLCYCWRPSTHQFLWTTLSYILVDWWPQIFAKCSVCRGEELNWPMSCAAIETASSTPLHGLLVLIWLNSGSGIMYLHTQQLVSAGLGWKSSFIMAFKYFTAPAFLAVLDETMHGFDRAYQ